MQFRQLKIKYKKEVIKMPSVKNTKNNSSSIKKKVKEAPLPKGHKDVMPKSYYNPPKNKKSGGVY